MLRDHEILQPLVTTLSEYVEEPAGGWAVLEADEIGLLSLHLISDLGFPAEEFLPFMERFRDLLNKLYQTHDFSDDDGFVELQEEFAAMDDVSIARIVSEVRHVACSGVHKV